MMHCMQVQVLRTSPAPLTSRRNPTRHSGVWKEPEPKCGPMHSTNEIRSVSQGTMACMAYRRCEHAGAVRALLAVVLALI